MDLNIALRFIFGLAIGSFLNVVIYRYDPEKNLFGLKRLSGRSHCPHCGKTLHWYELIPVVSFLFQRGRCRSCKERISFQYPVIELISGIMCAYVPEIIYRIYDVKFLELTGKPIGWFYMISGIFVLTALLLIVMSAIDLRLTIIPDEITIALAILGVMLIVIKTYYGLFGGDITHDFVGHYALIFGFTESALVNHFGSAGIGFLFFLAIFLVSRGRGMGFGDVKLAGALGLVLGWPDAPFALLLSFIIGAFSSILFITRGKKTMKSMIPFGPFIAVSACVVMFFGEHIVDFYFKLFP